jgi:hypothetical protein
MRYWGRQLRCQSHPHMPGSPTTPGRPGTRARAPVRVAFRDLKRVGTQNSISLSLRSAPACRHPSGIELPAMIARVDNIDGLIGIHRTFLRPDGSGKANIEPQRAMLGCAAGGAVRLAPAADALMMGCDGGLCVRSGIRGARGAQ